MSDRRTFLAGGVAASALLAAVPAEGATTPMTPPPNHPPPPTPAPAPTPSPAALAQAQAMRGFDPKLTDAQIAELANAIEAKHRRGARLNPDHGTFLKNADEPITQFHAGNPPR